MNSHEVLKVLSVAILALSTADFAVGSEVKTKVVAKTAVRSRNYGAVQIRTADLTPQTQFSFKTIQWGYGPGYYRGIYGYGPGWGYYNYYRPYAAYYPYYGYRSAYYGYRSPYYAYGPGYAYYDPAFAYSTSPAYYASPRTGYGGHGRGYGGCYHW